MRPSISRMPLSVRMCCHSANSSSGARASGYLAARVGSPPPTMYRSPYSTLSRTSPSWQRRVSKRKSGPSTCSASPVVSSLTFDAGTIRSVLVMSANVSPSIRTASTPSTDERSGSSAAIESRRAWTAVLGRAPAARDSSSAARIISLRMVLRIQRYKKGPAETTGPRCPIGIDYASFSAAGASSAAAFFAGAFLAGAFLAGFSAGASLAALTMSLSLVYSASVFSSRSLRICR